jgi:capsular polysaccharide biosynthesis protein
MGSPGEQRLVLGQTSIADAIRDHVVLIALVVVATVGSAIAYLALTPSSYQATADILVTPVSTSDTTLDGFSLFRDSAGPGSSVLTAARLATTPRVAAAAGRRLHSRDSVAALLRHVSAQPVGQANILSIVADAPSAKGAAAIANAFASTFVDQRTQTFQEQLDQRLQRLRASAAAIGGSSRDAAELAAIQDEIAGLSSYSGEADPTVEVARPATPPQSPSAPSTLLILMVAGLAGLLVGTAVAVWLSARAGLVQREAELARLGWLPVLARFPRSPTPDANAVDGEMAPELRDACRVLVSNLAGSGPSGAFPQSILVSSTRTSDLQATITASLATSLVGRGAKVLAVEVRPGSSGLEQALPQSLPPVDIDLFDEHSETLGNPLFDGSSAIRLIRAVSVPGRGLRRPREAQSVSTVLWRLEGTGDLMLLDAPPIGDVPDVIPIASAVEAVLLVVYLGETRVRELLALKEMLDRLDILPKGFVVLRRDKKPVQIPKHFRSWFGSGVEDGQMLSPQLSAEPEHDSA